MCFSMPGSTLKRVQIFASRIVTRLGRSEHITPVLHDLHWLPVNMRIVYTVLFILIKHYMNALLRK